MGEIRALWKQVHSDKYRDVAIPVIAGAATATLGLAFYVLLAKLVSPDAFGSVIAIISAASFIQLATVPQSWVYIATTAFDIPLEDRLGGSLIAEAGGFLLGLAISCLLTLTPLFDATLVVAFLAMGLAGCNAPTGYFRITSRWFFYFSNVVSANGLRIVFIVFFAVCVEDNSSTTAGIIFCFFLMPEILRFVFFYAAMAFQVRVRFSTSNTVCAFGILRKNWIYDVGSGATDVGDTFVLSLFVSPQVLSIYFFARRIASLATRVSDPYYSSKFRYIRAEGNLHAKAFSSIFLFGQGLSFLVFVLCAAALFVILSSKTLVDVALPSTVADMPLSFLMLLFAGCVIASNKWGRYFTILAGGEWALLGVRVLSFLIFVIVAWGAPVLRPEHSLVLGLFAFAAIEVIYLLFRTARFTPAVTPDNSSI